tara:strand:+ start:1119 stop:2105 length:987 start_codon:yes stop_codon:yes gene_type:complete
MSILLNGDCLEELKDLDDKSIDLIFCDLPYGQTSCKWDCLIDLDKLWIEFMRIKKLNTPIVMTCTTKFGVSLINSAPKKCPFRYDLIFCKSSSSGFLCSGKMPLRSHEMVYFFYEKLPFYDLSSHKHKFIKEVPTKRAGKDNIDNKGMIKNRSKSGMETQNKYSPPLPTSLIKENNNCIKDGQIYNGGKGMNVISDGKGKQYDPALPTSLIKEVIVDKEVYKKQHETAYGKNIHHHNKEQKNGESIYDPALPTSLLEIKSTRGKHSTEKPVQLMEWILKYYSKENDTILDPTMGSGSMGVACKNMNRNFIGIEKDPEIYEGAVNRLEN